MRTVVLACALAGCTYHPGSFSFWRQTFPGERVTVGCLDLSIDRRPVRDVGAVLEYQFGNHCDHMAIVDLARAHVIGRGLDGAEVALAPYDPLGEMGERWLDGRRAGQEAIAYGGDAPLAQICVDAASVAHATPAAWLCFANPDARVAAVAP